MHVPPLEPRHGPGPTDSSPPRIVVEAITSLIASLIGGKPTFTAIPFVSAQTLQELATELPAACGPVNNAGIVLDVRHARRPHQHPIAPAPQHLSARRPHGRRLTPRHRY